MAKMTVIIEDDRYVAITVYTGVVSVTTVEDRNDVRIDRPLCGVSSGEVKSTCSILYSGKRTGLHFDTSKVKLLIPPLDIFDAWQTTQQIVGTREKENTDDI